ncbi:unnamed protein product [Tuber aestivum]|uniref:Tyrosine specific protein phosphatases domain-containing protein n=1 Tax=Tuber aestivum TaxID=59557 RepID=A0A292PTU4_9PEZI|nr:unnamed protein product [Tuber aestivum]
MFPPPGRGNDCLAVGDKFVISLFGTSMVFTAEGNCVRLREYEKGKMRQIWVCQMNPEGRYGMRNAATGCFLGWVDGRELFCAMAHHYGCTWLTFTRLRLGGYSLMVPSPEGPFGTRLDPVQRSGPGSSSLSSNSGTAYHRFGLHCLKDSVFRRFEWVVPDRLARSSAPYYDGEDSDESINETSIEFLANHGIQNIISMNSVEISARERGKLRAAGISYSHIRALEFTAPTQEQFDQIWNAYEEAGVTVVYCGYGDGRTGMAISAIQLFEGRVLTDLDYRANGVQCPSQIEALNVLNERIHSVENNSGPSDAPDTRPPPYTAPEKDKPWNA